MKIKYSDGEVKEIEKEEKLAVETMRHTGSHILAQAVKRLYPNAKLGIGPAIENGFYYDFDDLDISGEKLDKIQEEMKKIVKENLVVETFSLSKVEALELMKDEKYKLEVINELPEDEKITFFKQGEYTDLCRGPHLLYTSAMGKFKLTSITGAYWKGNEKNKMLQRIYAIAFFTSEELEAYETKMEEAKKRDHRKLGKELELFMLAEEGPGFPFFLPKGMVLRNILEAFWRKKHKENGYQEIKTPIILNEDLWHRSGHWDHYKDNMYNTKIDDIDYALKPMNCPGGMLVYKSKIHSYRDFPQRVGELGLVHRHELSGTLQGLMRVRCFTQDDAHIFCLPEQIEEEIINLMNLIDEVYSLFGFKYKIELSTKPENSMGTIEQWDKATNALKHALEVKNLPYEINEGDGAFYGPKIDFHLEDCIGRTWQCGTIQLDFQMPEKFDLTYIGKDNEKHRPVMLHRVIFGSIERFIGILIEHYAGAFPLWLAPVQIKILSITDRHNEYASKVKNKLEEKGYRTQLDDRNEKIGYKIREAQLEKVPYMIIIGDNEVNENKLSLRSRDQGDMGSMDMDLLISKLK